MAIYAVVSIAGVPAEANPGEYAYWKHRTVLIQDRGPDVRGAVVEHLVARAETKGDAERAKEMTLEALKYLGIRVLDDATDQKWDFRESATIRVLMPELSEDKLAEAIASLGPKSRGGAVPTRLVVCDERENLTARRILSVSDIHVVEDGAEFPLLARFSGDLPVEVDPYASTAYLEAVL